MKRLLIVAVMAIGFLGANLALAANDSPKADESRVLPVLVAVNAEGKVVLIDPAIKLGAKQTQALKQAVETMITKPAMKDGHGVYSQFILQLAVSPDKSGDGGTLYTYIEARPAPSGPVHWVTERGHSGKSGRFSLERTQGSQQAAMPPPPPLVQRSSSQQ